MKKGPWFHACYLAALLIGGVAVSEGSEIASRKGAQLGAAAQEDHGRNVPKTGSGADRQAVKAELNKWTPEESEASKTARRYGKVAAEVALEVLQDPKTSMWVKRNACCLLGELGDERVVKPAIQLLENVVPDKLGADTDLFFFVYSIAYVMGNTQSPQAFDYLKRMTAETYWTKHPAYLAALGQGKPWDKETIQRFREFGLHGIAASGSPMAPSLLEQLLAGPAKDLYRDTYVKEAERRLRQETQKAEIEQVRKAKPPHEKALAKFWKRQEIVPSQDLAKAIVGEYEGTIYWAGNVVITGEGRSAGGIRIRFLEDGTFETNFQRLADKEATRLDPYRDVRPDSSVYKGQYKVIGPTQLIMAPGNEITAFGVSLKGDELTFYHNELNCFFAFRKMGSGTPRSAGPEPFAAVYRGAGFFAGSDSPQRAEGIEFIFAPQRHFTTNLGQEYDTSSFGFERCDGAFQIDPAGSLICHSAIHGGDFWAEESSMFSNWLYRDGLLYMDCLYMRGYGGVFVLSPFGKAVELDTGDLMKQICARPYSGTAYQPRQTGRIEEFKDVQIQFTTDGTFRSNFPEKMKRPRFPENAYPGKTGRFQVISKRHLLMGLEYTDGTMSHGGIVDFYLEGDKLNFTSAGLESYFALSRN